MSALREFGDVPKLCPACGTVEEDVRLFDPRYESESHVHAGAIGPHLRWSCRECGYDEVRTRLAVQALSA